MSKTQDKFTPGPWKWNGESLVSEAGEDIIFYEPADYGPFDTFRISDKDKPLLCAAPDLLAACQLAQKWLAN